MNNCHYTIRYSKKARRLQLRISDAGLQVIIPHTMLISKDRIQNLIQKKSHWVKKNLARFHKSDLKETLLPEKLDFPCIKHTWQISYIKTEAHTLSLFTNLDFQIKLMGPVEETHHCWRLLRKWLKNLALKEFSRVMTILSSENHLNFRKLSIRYNKTRWGSCNDKKDISLCCKILFLPPHLMRHILLHELCHTRFMNHGKDFWNLLTQVDPQQLHHRNELKKARQFIPNWLFNTP